MAKALSHRRSPTTSSGREVVSTVFDSYLSTVMLPDHLLTGLIKNVFEVCFTCLQSNGERQQFDKFICNNIFQSGLPSIDTLLVFSGDRLSSLTNLSMSGWFCVLLIAADVFNSYGRAIASNVINPFHLPKLLQRVVSLLYWYPSTRTDTPSDFDYFYTNNGEQYKRDLFMASRFHLSSVNDYIKHGGRLGKVLDKPNAHRLVELCVHTIPLYGHALFVSELVLEMVHRDFKKWIEKKTNHNSHITAVELSLRRDWGDRLYALYMYWKHGKQSEKQAAEIGLRRICPGAIACNVPQKDPEVKTIFESFQAKLDEMFKPPNVGLLRSFRTISMLPHGNAFWKAQHMCRACDENTYGEEGDRLLGKFTTIFRRFIRTRRQGFYAKNNFHLSLVGSLMQSLEGLTRSLFSHLPQRKRSSHHRGLRIVRAHSTLFWQLFLTLHQCGLW